MKIWLDDERQTPDGAWIHAFSFDHFHGLVNEAVNKGLVIDEISFDHDLGDRSFMNMNEKTGYDAICLIEEMVFSGQINAPLCHIHTANPSVRTKMEQAAEKINSQRS